MPAGNRIYFYLRTQLNLMRNTSKIIFVKLCPTHHVKKTLLHSGLFVWNNSIGKTVLVNISIVVMVDPEPAQDFCSPLDPKKDKTQHQLDQW